jgi:protease I
MAGSLEGKSVLIVATDGFEQSELKIPRDRLKEAGPRSTSPRWRSLNQGWDKTDWGRSVNVDKKLSDAKVADYDAIVPPGGVMNPDRLRVDVEAIELIRGLFRCRKTVAAMATPPGSVSRQASPKAGR